MDATTQPKPLQRILLSYSELQEKMHYDLRAQHPEWVEANGSCPTCDDYERRFAELIPFFRTGNLDRAQRAA